MYGYAAPGVLAYLLGASSTTAGIISTTSAAINLLPIFLTDNYNIRNLNTYHRMGSLFGVIMGSVTGAPLGAFLGLIKNDFKNVVSKSVNANLSISPSAGAVASSAVLLTNYCCQCFFQSRKEVENSLMEEKEKIASVLQM